MYDVSEFDVFDDPGLDFLMIHVFRLPPTKNEMQGKYKEVLHFHGAMAFVPSPSNVRVCTHLLIVKSSKISKSQNPIQSMQTSDIAWHFGYNIKK